MSSKSFSASTLSIKPAKAKSEKAPALLGLILLGILIGLNGCAASQNIDPDRPIGTTIFVSDPQLHPALIASLNALNTDSATFTRDLRREIGFEVRRKGWRESGDSAQSDWSVDLQILGYSPGGAHPFQGRARWKDPKEKLHTLAIDYGGLPGIEEVDPLPGDIRGLADWVVRQGLRNSRSKPDPQEYKPEMWMVF
jgi:hypothetical protein